MMMTLQNKLYSHFEEHFLRYYKILIFLDSVACAGTFFGYFYWRPLKHTIAFYLLRHPDTFLVWSVFGMWFFIATAITMYFVERRFHFLCGCAWLFVWSCMAILPWEPLYGLKPFYFLFIESIILELWLVRCYGNESIFVTIKAVIVLYLTFICIFSGFIWIFSGVLLEPLITVVNPGHYTNSLFPPMFEVLKKYRPFANQVIWDLASMYPSKHLDQFFVPPSCLPNSSLFSLLNKILSPSLYNMQAMHFYAPAPIHMKSYLAREMMHFYVSISSAPPFYMPADIAKYNFIWYMLPEYNSLYTDDINFLKVFLDNRVSTDILFLSIVPNNATTSPLLLATCTEHAATSNGFVSLSYDTAVLLNAAKEYSSTGHLNFVDYLGLLKLFAPSMKSYSFNYVSAFVQFFSAKFFKLLLFYSLGMIISIVSYRYVFNLMFRCLLVLANKGITLTTKL